MKLRSFGMGAMLSMLLLTAGMAFGQETFTGTVLKYGDARDPRTGTTNFTLEVKSWTPADRAGYFLNMLQEGGQDRLHDAIKDEDVGYFSLGNNVGIRINAAVDRMQGGKRHIYVLFERWTQFAELRGGYRSLDHPFGYIELVIDPRSGKGEGKYLAAAKIRWKRDKKSSNYQIEIEDYATFPAKLLSVRSDRRMR